jgi:hypothetical protein
MQLAKHVVQGDLLYLCQDKEIISVSESEHYRWLAFTCQSGEQIIQSVMLKRNPYQLTLPHQTALMLPLLFFKPNNVAELGLGGGNILRFINSISKEITIHSVENNSTVIDCFNQYFNPQNNPVSISFIDSKQWLINNKIHYDWYICDVYQQEIQSYDNAVHQLKYITANIKSNTCLSINLPDATDSEVNLHDDKQSRALHSDEKSKLDDEPRRRKPACT